MPFQTLKLPKKMCRELGRIVDGEIWMVRLFSNDVTLQHGLAALSTYDVFTAYSKLTLAGLLESTGNPE